ncbi:hypothetical protein CTAYLR_000351 [Chrysophaeum taylorii]|uniref:AB hydrolase-1 domain-containing protein n=1 Tax=Chrysophaeum taylorii TaxID=2483200 RepID=A0AAD7UFU8_9STRA|nr:hypothetical protein CTAYLR_000351 [Chrysophaeum taylorii]
MTDNFFKPLGSFVETTHGRTHYVIEGEGPVIVFAHGIMGTLVPFQIVARSLVAKGFRVLSFDLYDRGYSETSDDKYPLNWLGAHTLKLTIEVHVQQVVDLLNALKIAEPVTMTGHSLGGGIALAFAASHPGRVKGLVMIDSICLEAHKPFAAYLALTPVVGDLVVSLYGPTAARQFALQNTTDPDTARPEFEFMCHKIKTNPKFLASVASNNKYCRGVLGNLIPEFEAVCTAGLPVLLVWGHQDTVTPYAFCLKLQEIARDLGHADKVKEVSFPDAPHNIYFADAKPQEVAHAIAEFAAAAAAGRKSGGGGGGGGN